MSEFRVDRRYRVQRLGDKTGKHKDCFFFVIDLSHDKHAPFVLRAYALAIESENYELASSLRNTAKSLDVLARMTPPPLPPKGPKK